MARKHSNRSNNNNSYNNSNNNYNNNYNRRNLNRTNNNNKLSDNNNVYAKHKTLIISLGIVFIIVLTLVMFFVSKYVIIPKIEGLNNKSEKYKMVYCLGIAGMTFVLSMIVFTGSIAALNKTASKKK